MIRAPKNYVAALMILLLSVVGTAAIAEEEKPSGTVSIETKAVAVGVGFSWGEGVLTFQGKEYPFKIKGLSVIDLGISSISAQGEVYHLKNIPDFAGTFSAAEAGVAVGGGAGAQVMKNQNGVVMKLTSRKAGVQLKLAPEGLKVELK
ncbi:hypothetical protein [Desulfogranum marinum]|uniref:hypothetical protein n=1 Tax=Desulfogranum marinum TaxID=453220 RepID=UPI0029C8F1F1|nr:hypothetical protein [Desulfogranum marinum]